MRHKKFLKKLSRRKKHRLSLLINLSKSLFKYKSISTTLSKAKVLKSFIEKIITYSKINSLSKKRKLMQKFRTNYVEVTKIFSYVSKKYIKIKGGYTKIIKTNLRKGDSTHMSIIKLITY